MVLLLLVSVVLWIVVGKSGLVVGMLENGELLKL